MNKQTAPTADPSLAETQPVERIIGSYASPDAGPLLICVGAIHGNEQTGLVAARRVLKRLESDKPAKFRGRLVALAGNLAAANVPGDPPRYIENDLNRAFTQANIAQATQDETPSADNQQMLDLIAAIEHELTTQHTSAFLIDLHTYSSPGPPFVGVEDSIPGRRLAMHFQLPVLLGFEEHLKGLFIDHASNQWRCVSLIAEAGVHDDPASVDIHEAIIWTALHGAGLLKIDALSHKDAPSDVLTRAAGPHSNRFYDLRHTEPIANDDFEVTQSLRTFDPVRMNRTQIAVQAQGPILAPTSGLLFLPNRNPRRRIGDDGVFIVKQVGRVWMTISAWLRTDRIHRLLPRLAPGVRKCPDRDQCLMVDPHIAAVFKTQLFHLLGYRIIRHGPEEHLPPVKRLIRGLGTIALSAVRQVAGILSGGERAALPDQSDDDWIVARRTLDIHPPSSNMPERS